MGEPIDYETVLADIDARIAKLQTTRECILELMAGAPIFIDVEEIEAKDKERLLPTIEQVSGLVEDFTEGKSLRKYLEDLDE